jgi:hypothetical protein
MILKSAARDAGVHVITVECDCGNTFVNHTDADFVVCPNCKAKAQWRTTSTPVPAGFEAAPPMGGASEARSRAMAKKDKDDKKSGKGGKGGKGGKKGGKSC